MKNKTLLNWVPALMILCSTASFAPKNATLPENIVSEQFDAATITGTVRPGSSYFIMLYSTDGQLAASTSADENGNFTMTGIMPGIYKIAVTKSQDPKEPALYSGEVNAQDNTTTHLDITL